MYLTGACAAEGQFAATEVAERSAETQSFAGAAFEIAEQAPAQQFPGKSRGACDTGREAFADNGSR